MGELPLSVKAMPTAPRGGGLRAEDDNVTSEDRQAAPPDPIRRKSQAVHSATVAEDERQIEMDFGDHTELEINNPTEIDVSQVQEALGDLDRLEKEVSRAAELGIEMGEKLTSG